MPIRHARERAFIGAEPALPTVESRAQPEPPPPNKNLGNVGNGMQVGMVDGGDGEGR